MADAPSPFRVFAHDVENERATAIVRVVGAVVVLGGVAWLAVVSPTPPAALAGLVGVVVALAWIVSFVLSRRRIAAKMVLRLEPGALVIEEGSARTEVAWTDVTSIEVDEDRLVVRIARAGGDPVVIDPIWRGVGVYALADAVRAAHAAAPGRSGR